FHQPAGAPYADAALGNPRLRPQQAIQASLGVESAPLSSLPWLRGELTFFYKDLRDLPAPSDALVVRDGKLVPALYSDAGVGRVYGLDLLLRKELSKWFYGWIAYSL